MAEQLAFPGTGVSGLELHLGDCLAIMPTMEANSIDTIITDPPYALSEGESVQSISQRIYDALIKIGFPNLYQRYVEFFQRGDFAGVTGSRADLGSENGAIGECAGIGVPECTVDFESDSIVNQEIHNGDIAPGASIADGELSDERDAKREQFLGDFILKLGDMHAVDATGNVLDSALAEAFYSGFAVPIFAQVLPSSPSLAPGSFAIMLGDDDIGGAYDALCQSGGASGVVTLPRTINTLMLRFDLGGRPRELVATYRASHLATIGEFGGAQLIRAFPATGDLASVAQSCRIRFVVYAADGALAIYWLHLWIPKVADMKGIIPRGGFMGKEWDAVLPDPQVWRECLRVAKPGAILMAFGGTRTWHRLAVAIEDAGWEIRDTLMWLYGQGFPKSHDISKAIDKAAGAEREILGRAMGARNGNGKNNDYGEYGSAIDGRYSLTAPATEAAALWDGWGTALKPAWEPIILAMKPLDGTFAHNALTWGVAGLNVDGARIDANGEKITFAHTAKTSRSAGILGNSSNRRNGQTWENTAGRWPANLLLDECAADLLDAQSGVSTSSGGQSSLGAFRNGDVFGKGRDERWKADPGKGDTGGASRFFYVAKASRAERNAGLEGLPERDAPQKYGLGDLGNGKTTAHANAPRANNHPTVKPLALMRYLARLSATPTKGIIFDPFMGSGTTGMAAILEGRSFVGCEMDEGYIEIARRRIAHAQRMAKGA